MKNSMLVSAVLVTSSAISPAFAQSDSQVQIYGAVGASLSSKTQQSADGKPLQEVSNNVLIPSFMGFRGQEDLGGGLQAVFRLEKSVALDTGVVGRPATGTFWDRQSFVGLQGSWGSVTFGRQFHAMIDRVVRTTDMNNAGMLTVHHTPMGLYGVNRFAGFDNRVNNSIKYRLDTPTGLQLGASYAMGESASGGSSLGSSYSADVGYLDKTYNVGAGVVSYNSGTLVPGTASPAKHQMVVLGGSMALGSLRPYLSYYKATTDSAVNAALPEQVNSIVNLGLRWTPRPDVDLRAAYYTDKGRSLNNVNARDGRKDSLVLVGQLALSKRTLLNAVWANNRLTNGYRLEPVHNSQLFGTATPASSSVNHMSVGMVHLF